MNEQQEKLSCKPVDYLRVPVFSSYLASDGVVAEKEMFDNSAIIILQFADNNGKMRTIFAIKPDVFYYERNYYNIDKKEWRFKP